jgi:hypothetical protein
MNFQKKLLIAVAIICTLNLGAQELLEPAGLDQIKEILQTDKGIAYSLEKDKIPSNAISIAMESIDSMNSLIKEAIIEEGLANDGMLSIADTREINRYLVENYSNEWYQLRGVDYGYESTGYYAVDRRGVKHNTMILDSSAIRIWGYIYDLGFQAYDKNQLSNYTASKSISFTTLGYYLQNIMKDDIKSGNLYNPDYTEIVGTTDTNLDQIIQIIFQDKGLLRRISTGDMREGASSANAMNHLIIEAIIKEGLGNDGLLTPADIRTINNYLVTNHQDEWANLHGDDEDDEETAYHKVQNDGAYSRMFADNVMNSIADGIYHLGFKTKSKYNLVNEDGNNNKSFEKVAWWLDTILKSDLLEGKLINPAYEEVFGTTGTIFDKIIPYIYNDEGLLLKVSMGDIRAGAYAANEMNKLIVEAIRNTAVASDNYISSEEVKILNEYLVANYENRWRELHGDDEDNEETGYHRIQNDGAINIAYNTNLINSLADGIYHLGFQTEYKDRLVNEDGDKNKSFKQVAYWLNRSLKSDFEQGLFK